MIDWKISNFLEFREKKAIVNGAEETNYSVIILIECIDESMSAVNYEHIIHTKKFNLHLSRTTLFCIFRH